MDPRQPLRKTSKEIKDKAEILDIIKRAEVCRIAMVCDGKPYVVPMNFGFRYNTFYFHSSTKGVKIDTLKTNPEVCIEIDIDTKIWPGEKICKWGIRYRSVIAFGRVEFIESEAEKNEALDAIIRQYTDIGYDMDVKEVAGTALFKVTVDHITGKKAGW